MSPGPLARLCLSCAAIIAVPGVAARAEPVSPPPPPPGYDAKRPLDPADLGRKKEGGYVTGLPLANFDPNTGVGGGARAYYFFNGERTSRLFPYTPYLHRVFVQGFVTSKGLQFHWLDYDAPAIAGTPYRLRSQLIYLRNTSQHFFGVGDDTLAPLTFTGAGREFESFSTYEDELERVRADGTTLARYDHYDLTRPIWVVSVERTFARGLIRPMVGIGFTHASIDDYTGELVDAEDGETEAIMGRTRLREQCDLGRVVGCRGGWDNFVRLGISLDTRDFEPDPNRGVFVDAAIDLATAALGSDHAYARFLMAARGYASLLPAHTDLVIAGRVTVETQSNGVPVTSMNTIPYTEDPRTGPGGHRTLRGFRQDRFLSRHFALVNLELRWTFLHLETLAQRFAVGSVVFVDTGRVFDRLDDFTLTDWRRGQGAGVRIAWNQATIVAVDYGVSDEDSGLYINFNHQF